MEIRNLEYWFDRGSRKDSCFLICTMDYSLNSKPFKPLSFVISRDNKVLGYTEKIISNFKGYIDNGWTVNEFDKSIDEVIKRAIGEIIISEYINAYEDGEIEIGKDEDGNELYAEVIDRFFVVYDSAYVVRVRVKIHDSIYLADYGDIRLKSGISLSTKEQKFLFNIFEERLKNIAEDFLVSGIDIVYNALVEYVIDDVDFFSYSLPTITINVFPEFN